MLCYLVDALKLIEKQSGFLRLISYLHTKGERPITTIIEETETREELIRNIEERFSYVISHVASQRAKDLMHEMNLI